MKLDALYRDATKRLLSRPACAEFTRKVRVHPALGAFSGAHELLHFLNDPTPELAEQRSVVLRGLLTLYRGNATPLAAEILFAAYYQCLRALCRELRDELQTHDIEERRAMIVAAFFEAAAKTPLEADSPTSLVLALKTRQFALRALCRGSRVRRFEVPWTERAHRIAGRMATPESILLFRETERAVDDLLACSERCHALHRMRARKPLRDPAQATGPFSAELRAAHPMASAQELRRMHQRARTQQCRARRATREQSQESVSQIRGYLDLWEQEGWQ